RVATIKHTTHDFNVDTEGKDSWKHAQAGSECTVLASARKVALFREADHDLSPSELARMVPDDIDIVLAEGFKSSRELKIEVHRRGTGEPVCPAQELLAIVSDEGLELGIPRFSPDDTQGVADLIEKRILEPFRKRPITILADGKPLPLTPFVSDLYRRVISEMVSSLKGGNDLERIEVTIRRPK
ncbi:MAG: molybdopterin-guanine dinucleotide biosynthesis protein B, partial [Chloroflexi bacterium]|nr:molybdopterin-guanine dinucleotide biosynthesis protein B [Chloroflexota bacterium]